VLVVLTLVQHLATTVVRLVRLVLQALLVVPRIAPTRPLLAEQVQRSPVRRVLAVTRLVHR
jgi:hypothetical protein